MSAAAAATPQQGKGALLLEPAESCEPTAVLNADIAAQEEPAGEPPQAEHSDRSDLLRCYSSPSKTPRTLNMPMHSASPPERPPASVERALFQSAGDSGEAPARQQQVWDSAEGLACSMSRAKAANNAAMAALIGSCEALFGRQGRQPLDVPALRAVLSTSLREDSLVEGLIARVQAIEDARSKVVFLAAAGRCAYRRVSVCCIARRGMMARAPLHEHALVMADLRRLPFGLPVPSHVRRRPPPKRARMLCKSGSMPHSRKRRTCATRCGMLSSPIDHCLELFTYLFIAAGTIACNM